VLALSAKPSKAEGAIPPLRVFSFLHCEPQNVTGAGPAAAWSPMTKMPRLGNAKTITLLLASTDGR
jgi:hypothetical protein